MPTTICFSYPPSALPGAGNSRSTPPLLPAMRSMPLTCYGYPYSRFSYPGDESWDTPRHEAVPPLPGLRQMPYGTCFRY